MLVVAGDGGFMMNSQELETARRMKLNLVVLIIEDHAYGMIRWKQAVDGFADWGLTFGNPDFVAYAAAYGARGRRVTTASGLAPALEEAFSAGGVQLIVGSHRLQRKHPGSCRRTQAHAGRARVMDASSPKSPTQPPRKRERERAAVAARGACHYAEHRAFAHWFTTVDGMPSRRMRGGLPVARWD